MVRTLLTHSVLRKTKAAIAFDVLAGVVILVQLGLASGMPWGELTWGGAYPGVLPHHMRGVSLFSALLLLAFAYEVSARAGLVRLRLKTSAKTVWVVVGYSALGGIHEHHHAKFLGKSHLVASDSRASCMQLRRGKERRTSQHRPR